MSKQKPRRVNYRINYCSSEDPEGPVSQLVLQSSQARGWISKRFAPYPQTIVVQLLQLTLVNSISFLSHQSKICTRIEIEGKDDQNQNWVRLGYTTLQSGANTNYQSRQLRNVSLGSRLILLLKFTFSQNYANHINIFNQIGIIALLVYGEKATVQKDMVRNKQGNVVANLSDLDRQTILKLKNLEEMKKQAIELQRFDDAKKFKEDIQSLQSNLPALILLEKEKKDAINREDFDQAKEIADRMKRLRGPMVLARMAINSANSFDNKSIDVTPKRKPVLSSMGEYNDPQAQGDRAYYKVPSRNSEPRNNRKSFDLNSLKQNNSTTIPFDEIKIRPKQRYPIEEEIQKQGAVGIFNRKKPLPPKYVKRGSVNNVNQQSSQPDQMLSPRLPSLKKLQKLTPQQFDQCSRYFPIFNEVTFEYLLSKDHSYREKGLATLNDILEKTDAEDKRSAQQFVSASIFAVRKLIDDRILSVLMGAVDFFGMVMKKFRPGAIGASAKNVRFVLQRLALHLGNPSDKFRQVCEDVFAALPAHGLTNRELCFEVMIDCPPDKNPKVIAGKLRMLARIVEKYSVSVEVDDLIDFGKKHVQDKNSDVRSGAVNLLAKLSREMGYQNLYNDLSSLKPQVIKLIEDRIEADGGTIRKIEISKNQSKKTVGLALDPKRPEKPPNNPEYYCDYCKVYDKRLQNEDFRDQHLYTSCRMITLCPECSQAIQVSVLNNHLLAECANHKYYKRCPKCKEAISTKEYNAHTKIKDCLTAKAPAQANRCPLCHEDIEAGEAGWTKHLVREGCPLNPRH